MMLCEFRRRPLAIKPFLQRLIVIRFAFLARSEDAQGSVAAVPCAHRLSGVSRAIVKERFEVHHHGKKVEERGRGRSERKGNQ